MRMTLCAMLFLVSITVSAKTQEPYDSKKRGILFVSHQQFQRQKMMMPAEMRQEIEDNQKQMHEHGYVSSVDPDVKMLRNIRKDTIMMLRQSDREKSPYDTNIKSRLSSIKLSFKFKLPAGLDVIGYAAEGSYIKHKDGPEGWNGVVTFFEDKEVGICRYDYTHIISTQIDKDEVRYLVNKKPTDLSVVGKPHDGYMYYVKWYTAPTEKTNTVMHSLGCANMKFDKNIMSKMVELAKHVDAAMMC